MVPMSLLVLGLNTLCYSDVFQLRNGSACSIKFLTMGKVTWNSMICYTKI